MKIVMLGHSNAGKTTYLASMYQSMLGGVGGFSVRAADPEVHDRLPDLAAGIRGGSYPPGTDRPDAYHFILRHESRDVLEFRWQDYRGGALLERSSSEEARELSADLAAADGIVIFVDAPALERNDPLAHHRVRRLVLLTTNSLQDREKLTPVVLAFTKFDLVQAPGEPMPLVETFLPLMTAVAESTIVHGTLVPVACGPEPANVVVPVLWCLHIGIRARAAELFAAAAALAAAATSARSQISLWDWAASWLTDVPTWGDIARGHERSATEEIEKIRPLVEPAERLGDLFGHADLLTF